MRKIEKAFGAVIRKRRLAAGYSQEDFADHAGVHRTYMSAIELGKVSVSIGIAAKLAKALQTTVSELFRDVESPRESEHAGE